MAEIAGKGYKTKQKIKTSVRKRRTMSISIVVVAPYKGDSQHILANMSLAMDVLTVNAKLTSCRPESIAVLPISLRRWLRALSLYIKKRAILPSDKKETLGIHTTLRMSWRTLNREMIFFRCEVAQLVVELTFCKNEEQREPYH